MDFNDFVFWPLFLVLGGVQSFILLKYKMHYRNMLIALGISMLFSPLVFDYRNKLLHHFYILGSVSAVLLTFFLLIGLQLFLARGNQAAKTACLVVGALIVQLSSIIHYFWTMLIFPVDLTWSEGFACVLC